MDQGGHALSTLLDQGGHSQLDRPAAASRRAAYDLEGNRLRQLHHCCVDRLQQAYEPGPTEYGISEWRVRSQQAMRELREQSRCAVARAGQALRVIRARAQRRIDPSGCGPDTGGGAEASLTLAPPLLLQRVVFSRVPSDQPCMSVKELRVWLRSHQLVTRGTREQLETRVLAHWSLQGDEAHPLNYLTPAAVKQRRAAWATQAGTATLYRRLRGTASYIMGRDIAERSAPVAGSTQRTMLELPGEGRQQAYTMYTQEAGARDPGWYREFGYHYEADVPTECFDISQHVEREQEGLWLSGYLETPTARTPPYRTTLVWRHERPSRELSQHTRMRLCAAGAGQGAETVAMVQGGGELPERGSTPLLVRWKPDTGRVREAPAGGQAELWARLAELRVQLADVDRSSELLGSTFQMGQALDREREEMDRELERVRAPFPVHPESLVPTVTVRVKQESRPVRVKQESLPFPTQDRQKFDALADRVKKRSRTAAKPIKRAARPVKKEHDAEGQCALGATVPVGRRGPLVPFVPVESAVRAPAPAEWRVGGMVAEGQSWDSEGGASLAYGAVDPGPTGVTVQASPVWYRVAGYPTEFPPPLWKRWTRGEGEVNAYSLEDQVLNPGLYPQSAPVGEEVIVLDREFAGGVRPGVDSATASGGTFGGTWEVYYAQLKAAEVNVEREYRSQLQRGETTVAGEAVRLASAVKAVAKVQEAFAAGIRCQLTVRRGAMKRIRDLSALRRQVGWGDTSGPVTAYTCSTFALRHLNEVEKVPMKPECQPESTRVPKRKSVTVRVKQESRQVRVKQESLPFPTPVKQKFDALADRVKQRSRTAANPIKRPARPVKKEADAEGQCALGAGVQTGLTSVLPSACTFGAPGCRPEGYERSELCVPYDGQPLSHSGQSCPKKAAQLPCHGLAAAKGGTWSQGGADGTDDSSGLWKTAHVRRPHPKWPHCRLLCECPAGRSCNTCQQGMVVPTDAVVSRTAKQMWSGWGISGRSPREERRLARVSSEGAASGTQAPRRVAKEASQAMCPAPLGSRVEVRYEHTNKRGKPRYEWNVGRVVAEEGHGLQRQVHVDFDHSGLWPYGILTHSPDMCLAADSMAATPPTFQKEKRVKAGAATAANTVTTQRHPASQPVHRSGDFCLMSEYPSARRVPLLAGEEGAASREAAIDRLRQSWSGAAKACRQRATHSAWHSSGYPSGNPSTVRWLRGVGPAEPVHAGNPMQERLEIRRGGKRERTPAVEIHHDGWKARLALGQGAAARPGPGYAGGQAVVGQAAVPLAEEGLDWIRPATRESRYGWAREHEAQ